MPELLSQWLYNKHAPLIKVDVHDDSDHPAGSVVISQVLLQGGAFVSCRSGA